LQTGQVLEAADRNDDTNVSGNPVLAKPLSLRCYVYTHACHNALFVSSSIFSCCRQTEVRTGPRGGEYDPAQHWSLTSKGELVCALNGFVLTVKHNQSKESPIGCGLCLSERTGHADQQWALAAVPAACGLGQLSHKPKAPHASKRAASTSSTLTSQAVSADGDTTDEAASDAASSNKPAAASTATTTTTTTTTTTETPERSATPSLVGVTTPEPKNPMLQGRIGALGGPLASPASTVNAPRLARASPLSAGRKRTDGPRGRSAESLGRGTALFKGSSTATAAAKLKSNGGGSRSRSKGGGGEQTAKEVVPAEKTAPTLAPPPPPAGKFGFLCSALGTVLEVKSLSKAEKDASAATGVVRALPRQVRMAKRATDFKGLARQRFQLNPSGEVEHEATRLVLEVANHLDAAKHWSLTSKGELVCALNGFVLTVKHGSAEDGAAVWLNERNGTKAQQWGLELPQVF
jgi:hypothetical protein